MPKPQARTLLSSKGEQKEKGEAKEWQTDATIPTIGFVVTQETGVASSGATSPMPPKVSSPVRASGSPPSPYWRGTTLSTRELSIGGFVDVRDLYLQLEDTKRDVKDWVVGDWISRDVGDWLYGGYAGAVVGVAWQLYVATQLA